MKTKLIQGDNILSLKKLPDNSVDSVVTDPPYGLSFMNKKWDHQVPSIEFWKEVYRVLKPGGHVLSFGGTRTYHRMTVNIEDAGFEIRDQIMWLYGSGFPKSHNIGKSVDKIRGNEREPYERPDFIAKSNKTEQRDSQCISGEKGKYTKGTSEWEGWGTALKPANEPICVARKPLSEKTIADNVLKWGTGGINIGDCRVSLEDGENTGRGLYDTQSWKNTSINGVGSIDDKWKEGRFPANIILDEEAGMALDEQSGNIKSTGSVRNKENEYDGTSYKGKNEVGKSSNPYAGEKGGASRFFYCPKVSKKERNAGCEELEEVDDSKNKAFDVEGGRTSKYDLAVNKNTHPTVKPIDLMAYLCRLITPPNGIVLDPFMGSGSTGCAAVQEGFRFCGMEMDEEYFKIATKRIEHYENKEIKK